MSDHECASIGPCPVCLQIRIDDLEKVVEQARRVALNPSSGSRHDDLVEALRVLDGEEVSNG